MRPPTFTSGNLDELIGTYDVDLKQVAGHQLDKLVELNDYDDEYILAVGSPELLDQYEFSTEDLIAAGRLDILRHRDFEMTDDMVELAAASNNVELIQYLMDKGAPLGDAYMSAIVNGSPNAYRHLRQFVDEPDQPLNSLIDEIIDLDAIKNAIKAGLVPDESTLSEAAAYGRRDIIEYLMSIGIKPTRDAFEEARTYGETETAMWLTQFVDLDKETYDEFLYEP